MKVGINARLLSDRAIRGWNRYTVNLLAELPNSGVRPVLYSERPIDPTHLRRLPPGTYDVRESGPMRYLHWEQWWLPRQCERDRVDILHCPLNFGLPWCSQCPRVLTLHDAISAVGLNAPGRLLSRLRPGVLASEFSHWVARTRADRIITVSHHAKADLVRHWNVPADRIRVIYEAADERFHRPVDDAERRRVREKYALDRPYVFYIGGWETRKNVPFLIDAFARADLAGVDLVLAGGAPDQRAALVWQAERLGLGGRSRLLGWVDDDDLPALYAAALCFVYPSRYEGFGLQLCEAMAAGCPTLAANATCLPEILGDGGETFDLQDPSDLALQLRRISEVPAQRLALVARSRERAKVYSWRRTAEATANVYEHLKCRESVVR